MKPRIGLVLGDPCGVGPEVTAKLLARPEVAETADVLLVADPDVYACGQRIADVDGTLDRISLKAALEGTAPLDTGGCRLVDPEIEPAAGYDPGWATLEGGRYVIETLRGVLALARQGKVDAVCYAPLNKEAMSMAGSTFPDEILWIANEVGHSGPLCDCTFVDGLWTARVTSHVPVAEISKHLTEDRVIEVTRLIHDTLRRAGTTSPRIAMASLNPHAGDGGLIGREEIDVLRPAVAKLAAQGIAVEGPFPPDTVFLRGRDGEYDAVVTMYHDQGQIALKLIGFGRAVTVIAGLDIPVATPAQGTAFDIVGKGIASPEGLQRAFAVACDMALTKRVV